MNKRSQSRFFFFFVRNKHRIIIECDKDNRDKDEILRDKKGRKSVLS